MLVEMAIGDAYGAGFEYADSAFVKSRNLLMGYVTHPWHKGFRPGHYTDDTQMSLAIAEALVSKELWTPAALAAKFVEVFKRDPRAGYSGSFFAFLKKVNDGEEFLQAIRPNSDKSGAAMRAAPIGVCPSIAEVIEKSATQAAITHNTQDGIHAAVAASLMTHYFIYGIGHKSELGAFLESQVKGRWSEPWTGQVGAKGWMSVRAAITAIARSDSMSTLLKRCVSFTGDVDTVAAIALAAASCSKEIKKDIPDHLVQKIEDGRYGKSYLAELDEDLMSLIREGKRTPPG